MDKNNENATLNELTCGVEDLNLEKGNIKIKEIACGKYHSLFLSENGEVYGIGVNRFGQLGHSNFTLFNSGELIKIEFPGKDTKITQIKCGDNHNLMLSEKGELFANGDNSQGQLDGNLNGFLYYECTPKKLNLFNEENEKENLNFNQRKIKKIYAKHNRSAVLFDDGTAKFWGGFCYSHEYSMNNFPQYDGKYFYANFIL